MRKLELEALLTEIQQFWPLWSMPLRESMEIQSVSEAVSEPTPEVVTCGISLEAVEHRGYRESVLPR